MSGTLLRRRPRLLPAAAALLALSLAACGIATDDVPRPLADETSTTPPVGPSTASTTVAVYLSSESLLVRSVRPITGDISPRSALEALLLPTSDDERGQGLISSIPPGTTVLGAESAGGIVTVNFSPEWAEQAAPTTVQAYGQVVLTLTDLPGVDAVRFQADGQPVLTPPTMSTSPGEAVTAADYAELKAE